MAVFLLLLIVGTAVWVYVDAKNLGVRRGMLKGGLLDSGAGEWAVGTLILWIVVFPMYLGTRPKYVELRKQRA